MTNKTKKRFEREHSKARTALKTISWYCAGCKERHPNGERCPTPRLYAKAGSVHGSNS